MAEKRKRGRPSIYSAALAERICAELAKGRTLKDVCRDDNMPVESAVRNWALEDKNGFFALYAKAREIGYQAMADETLDIADNGINDWMERNGQDDAGWQANGEHVSRSRLRVDTRKWFLAKALPKIYGDKISLDHESPKGTMTPKQAIDVSKLSSEALAEIMALHDKSDAG